MTHPAVPLPAAVGDWIRLRCLAVSGPVAAGLDAGRGLVRIALPGGEWAGSVPGFESATAIALSPNGQWLVVGTRSSAARLRWPSGEVVSEDGVPTGTLVVDIDDEGNRVVASSDGHLWVDSGGEWGSYTIHGARIVAVQRRGPVVVSSDRTGHVAWVELDTGKARVGAIGDEQSALLIEDDRVFVGGADGSLRRWRPSTGRLQVLGRVDGGITQLLRWAGGLAILHGRCTTTHHVEGEGAKGIVVTHRGVAVGAGCDEYGVVWTASRGEGLRSVRPGDIGPRPPFVGHRAGVRAIVEGQDALWTCGRDGSLCRWDRSGRLQASFELGRAGLQRLLVLPGGRIVVGDTAGLLQVRQPDGAPTDVQVRAHEGPLTALGWLPGLQMIVTGGADGVLRTWEPERLGPVAARHDHADRLRCLAVLDDDLVLTGSYDGTLALVPPLGGSVLARMEGHLRPVLAVAAAGDALLSGSLDGTVRRWTRAGDAAGSVLVDAEGVVGLHPLPRSPLWLVSCRSGGVALLDASTLEVVDRLPLGAPPDGALVLGGRVYVGDQRGGLHRLAVEDPPGDPGQSRAVGVPVSSP